MNDNVIPHPTAWSRTDLTPDETLQGAAQYDWQDVIVCGFCHDTDSLVVRGSNMSRERALWIAEHLRLHAMDRL